MIWPKAKQEKQRKTDIVRSFMECYALSVNFMLFYDFDLKYTRILKYTPILEAVNYYHKVIHLGCCSRSRSASEFLDSLAVTVTAPRNLDS